MTGTRKVLAIVVGLAIVFGTAGTNPAHAELITDGSFEVNTNSTPGNGQGSELGAHNYAGSTWGDADVTTHWDKDNRVWYVTDSGDNEFPDGDFAYSIDASSIGGVDRLWQSGISLSAGRTYKLSFEMWGDAGTPMLDATLTGPQTLTLFNDTTTNGTDGVAEKKTSSLFAPLVSGSYTLAFFRDFGSDGNHAWIDAVSMVEDLPLGPNLVTDGSFEVNTNGTPGSGQGSELGAHNYAGSTWGDADVTTHWDKDSRVWYVTDSGDNEFPDGDFAYRIDSRLDLGGADALWQDGIPLTAGQEYMLQFAMWGETSASAILDAVLTGPDTIVLLDDAATIGNDGLAEVKMALFTPTVTGLYRLSFFTDINNPGNHTWIDDVAIRAVTPEPTSLALLALGGLGLWRRRRKR